jgi:hypothetical protein
MTDPMPEPIVGTDVPDSVRAGGVARAGGVVAIPRAPEVGTLFVSEAELEGMKSMFGLSPDTEVPPGGFYVRVVVDAAAAAAQMQAVRAQAEAQGEDA